MFKTVLLIVLLILIILSILFILTLFILKNKRKEDKQKIILDTIMSQLEEDLNNMENNYNNDMDTKKNIMSEMLQDPTLNTHNDNDDIYSSPDVITKSAD